jgi:uncharacterized SAM-dependent methyltransferase
MRKIYTYFMIISFFGMVSGSAFADNASMNNLNDRLRSLQNRLLSFNQSTLGKVKDGSDALVLTPIAQSLDFSVYDSVLFIDEDLLEGSELVELDSELGANLTVLFHDSEFFEELNAELREVKSVAESEFSAEPTIAVNNKYAEIKAHRQARYEDLKRRFLLACSTN